MPTLLPDPQIIRLEGADAIAFAHAQFASDVAGLRNGCWQWSAWLSAQGRVRAFFHLLRLADDRLLLLLRGGSAADLRAALARFVLRAKLRIELQDDLSAVIVSTRPADALARDQIGNEGSGALRLSLAGSRTLCLLPRPATPVDADGSAHARNTDALADIDAGLPTLAPALDDLLLPDWMGLRELGAVSVGKGCYPGQEIVARLHFKGGNKRWLHRVAFSATHLPVLASRLQVADDDGIVISAAWSGNGKGRALAALREGATGLPVSETRAEGGISILGVERVTASPD